MPGADVDGLLRSGVASLCLAAGVLHMSAAADHSGMASHVTFFVLVAVAQSALAAAVVWGRPGRWLAAAAGGNLAVALVWVLSRTTGLPVDGTSAPEAIGFKDGISTVLEIGVVAGAGLWWLLPEAARQAVMTSRRLASTAMGTAVWALGASGLFAGHTHSAGHAHGAAHSHGAGVHAHPPDQVDGPQDPHAADAGHHRDHAHPPDAVVAADPPADGHPHAGGAAHATPDPPGSHHHDGPAARRASTARASSPHDHDHGREHEQVEPGPLPSQAAGHRHSGAATDAAHDPDPGHGHGHDDGHRYDHGSGAGHDRGDGHDHPDDRQRPGRDRDDNDGAPSALDDVLKLIRAH